jgi:hypothetical protein
MISQSSAISGVLRNRLPTNRKITAMIGKTVHVTIVVMRLGFKLSSAFSM